MRYFSHIPSAYSWFTRNGINRDGEDIYIVEEISEKEYNKRKEIDSRPLYHRETPFQTHIVRQVHKYPEPNTTYELADGHYELADRRIVEAIDASEAFRKPKPNLRLLL